jgi:hypothetical protein
VRTQNVRTRILLCALAAAVVVPGPASQAAEQCGSTLPAAPAGLPTPVVFRTTCGSYRARGDGAVTHTHALRSPWGAPSRFRIGVRDDHVVLVEDGRVRWRSKRVFRSPESDFDSVALGKRSLAFSFMHGRLWVSRLDAHEHAVGWSEGALAWTKRGDLLTVRLRHGKPNLAVRDRNGLHPHLIARQPKNYLVDDATQTVIYVTAFGSLLRSDGRTKQTLADLGSLGFGLRATLQVLPRNMIAISSSERLTVLRYDGSVFAAMKYPADSGGLTHGWPQFAVAADRVVAAVELDRPKGGTAGEDVYLLRAGDHQGTRLARLQDDWLGCGWMVTMVWHGDWVLYSDSVVDVLAIDTSGGAQVDLSKTARQLPGVHVDENSGEYVGLDFAVWG